MSSALSPVSSDTALARKRGEQGPPPSLPPHSSIRDRVLELFQKDGLSASEAASLYATARDAVRRPVGTVFSRKDKTGLRTVYSANHQVLVKMQEVVGRGTYLRVKVAVNMFSGERVACGHLPLTRHRPAMRRVLLEGDKVHASVSGHPAILPLLLCFLQRTPPDKECLISFTPLCPTTLGAELRKRREGGAPIPVQHAVRTMMTMAEGLNHMHALHGSAHRDLKPDNVFFDADGNVRIADFGFSVRSTAPQEVRNECCGSAYYLAPEVARWVGSLELCPDSRIPSDIWALGCILYEMITLNRFAIEWDPGPSCPQPARLSTFLRAVAELSPAAVDARLTTGLAILDPSVRPGIQGLLSEMLAVKPAARPSAFMVIEACRALLSSLPQDKDADAVPAAAAAAAGGCATDPSAAPAAAAAQER